MPLSSVIVVPLLPPSPNTPLGPTTGRSKLTSAPCTKLLLSSTTRTTGGWPILCCMSLNEPSPSTAEIFRKPPVCANRPIQPQGINARAAKDCLKRNETLGNNIIWVQRTHVALRIESPVSLLRRSLSQDALDASAEVLDDPIDLLELFL